MFVQALYICILNRTAIIKYLSWMLLIFLELPNQCQISQSQA